MLAKPIQQMLFTDPNGDASASDRPEPNGKSAQSDTASIGTVRHKQAKQAKKADKAEVLTPQKIGKLTIERLLKVRREIIAGNNGEAEYVPVINLAIERIRELSQLTDTQRCERILKAIEISGCSSLVEIAEDTRIDREIVKALVNNLISRNILYLVNRFIPGSGRQYKLIKSRRVNSPEGV